MTTTTKATRVTLNTILFASAPALPALAEGETEYSREVLDQNKSQVQEFILNQGKEFGQFILNKATDPAQILLILKSAVKQIPAIQKELEEEAAAAAAAAKELAEKEAAAAAAAALEAEKELEAEKNRMMELLTGAGYDVEVVKTMIEAGIGKKPDAQTKGTYSRVAVTVNGKGYDIPVRGNMSEELKELVKAEGFEGNREGFITKFRNVPEVAATPETAGE